MSSKPLILYSHRGTPNPFKAALFLEELGVPYTVEDVGHRLKVEPFISVNPNGRVPAIHDPNTNVTVFESGAIVEYLVETYDKENRLTYTSGQEKWQLKSWLFYQVSGQGPYYGQKAWFSNYHPEKVPSAEERYANEIKRVIKVIEAHLTKTGGKWLVGDKVTYADLAWLPWENVALSWLLQDGNAWAEKEAPKYLAWIGSLKELESWKKVTSHPDLIRPS